MQTPVKNNTDNLLTLENLLRLESASRRLSAGHKSRIKSLMAGRHSSSRRGRGMDFLELRSYARGDDIRSIDWKVTARTQKPHSRVFSEEKERPVFVLTDMSRPMGFGSKRTLKSVVAAEAASLIAFKVEQEGDRMGAMILHEGGYDLFRVQRSRKQTLALLEKLIERSGQLKNHQHENPQSENLARAMERMRELVTKDYFIVVISDFRSGRKQVIDFLGELTRHNDAMLLRISDPMEFEIPDSPLSNGSAVLTVRSREEKSRMAAEIQRQRQDFREKMDARRIPLHDLSTETPLQEQIYAIVERHGR